jgi:hypothetical protein
MTDSPPSANPYPGLRSFEGDDAGLFFGRERETDELRRRLRTARFLAVIGTSGSGKSSLVRSGLVPSLHGGFMAGAGSSWRVAITRPGEDPIGRLVAALDSPEVLHTNSARADTYRALLDVTLHDSSLGLVEAVQQARLPPDDNLLVVVDQFEELFRFRAGRAVGAAGDDGRAFVRLLLEAARQTRLPIFIVITMRSEFMGDCAAFERLPEALNGGHYLIPRLTRDGMRAAIADPATVSGATMAPRLLTRLLNEVGDDPDQLPVLQHALMRTWQEWRTDHRPGEPIDNRHYDSVGTMREALSRHADEAWRELMTDADRRMAERLFRSLTTVTDGGHLVRRPVAAQRLAEICGTDLAGLARVVEPFGRVGRAFVQPPAAGLGAQVIVDISHESLMRLWQRLVGWVEEEARSVEIYRRIARGAVQHEAREASLWRPPELTLGLRWLRDAQPTAAWAGDAAEFDQAERFLARSRRFHRIRRSLLAVSVAAVVVLALVFLQLEALRQKELAQAQHKIAEANRKEAEAQRKIADTQIRENARLEAQLQSQKSTPIKSELLRWITVLTPEVMPREILEVKVATQSSRVQVFGIFAGPRGPQRVQGRYAPESGGIYLEYTISAGAEPGPRTASVTVQQIGTSREETFKIDYTVIPQR